MLEQRFLQATCPNSDLGGNCCTYLVVVCSTFFLFDYICARTPLFLDAINFPKVKSSKRFTHYIGMTKNQNSVGPNRLCLKFNREKLFNLVRVKGKLGFQSWTYGGDVNNHSTFTSLFSDLLNLFYYSYFIFNSFITHLPC